MRALKVAVTVMTVLIVAGVTTLGVLIARRMAGGASGVVRTTLEEPVGTRIVGMAALPTDRLALQLQGGGPDRVVVVDLRAGRIVGAAGLGR